MTNGREKVAPWERYTDGEWHEIRRGPEGEARATSAREFRRHYQSMRVWCGLNQMRGQLSRTDAGRILRVRLTPDNRAAERSRIVGTLAGKSRGELGLTLVEAVQLLNYAMHLRQYGERAPGGDETWQRFDRDAEALLRKLRHGQEGSR